MTASTPPPTPAPGSSASPASLAPLLQLASTDCRHPVLGTVACSGVQGDSQLEVLQPLTVKVSAVHSCVPGGPGRPHTGCHCLLGGHWDSLGPPAHRLVSVWHVDVILSCCHLLSGPKSPRAAESLDQGGDVAAAGVCPQARLAATVVENQTLQALALVKMVVAIGASSPARGHCRKWFYVRCR